MAGTAIAVALVPPVCAAGLTAASADWGNAFGASLLFAANLLGIVMGGIAVLVCRERFLRRRLVRSRRGQAALVTAVVMSIGILMPLSEGSKRQRSQLQARQMGADGQIKSQIEGLIAEFLMRKTLTFQTDLASVSLDLNGNDRTRVIDVSVYASDPTTPSFEQVEQVQTLINKQISQPLRISFQLRVQRIPITVVSGSEHREQLRIVEEQAAVDERLKLLEKQLTLLTRTNERVARRLPTRATGHQTRTIRFICGRPQKGCEQSLCKYNRIEKSKVDRAHSHRDQRVCESVGLPFVKPSPTPTWKWWASMI